MKSKVLILFIGIFLLVGLLGGVSAKNFIIQNESNPGQYYFVVNGTTGNVNIPYNVSAGYFVGDGRYLTNLNSSALNSSAINYWLKNGNNLYYNSGNVGIGTTSPSQKLDVAGTVNAYQYLINGTAISAGSLGALTGSGTANYVPLWNGTTSQTNSVIYQNGTNVGIGTSSPDANLQITGDTGLHLQNSAGNANAYFVPVLTPTYGLAEMTGTGVRSIFYDNLNHGIVIGSTYASSYQSPTNGAIIQGNVGIGTTNPGAKLEVQASSTTSTDIAQFSNSNSVYKAKFALDSSGSGYLDLQDASNNNNVHLESLGNSWLNGGNVGIGTPSPTTPLYLSSSTSGSEFYVNNTVNSPRITLGNGQNTWSISNENLGSFPQNSVLTFGISSSYASKLAINGNGDVGIGTTTPSQKLDVSGNVNAYQYLVNGTPISAGSLGAVTGVGTVGYLPVWNGTTSLNDSVVKQVSSSTGGSISVGSQLTLQTDSGVGKIHNSADNTRLFINAGSAQGSPYGAYLYLEGNNYGGTNAGGNAHLSSSNSGNLYLDIAGNSKLTVLNNGRVGIGTTSPNAKFEVNDGGNKSVYIGGSPSIGAPDLATLGAGVMLSRTNMDYADSGIASYTSTSNGNNLAIKARTDVVFVSGNSNTENMRIKENGQIGINNSNPSATLDVKGSVKLESTGVTTFTEGGALVVSG